jgi:hypothetical protein
MSDARTVDVEQVTVRQYAICSCGERMKPTGVVFTSNPPKFHHECVCGNKELLNFTSGEIQYRDKPKEPK